MCVRSGSPKSHTTSTCTTYLCQTPCWLGVHCPLQHWHPHPQMCSTQTPTVRLIECHNPKSRAKGLGLKGVEVEMRQLTVERDKTWKGIARLAQLD